MENNKILLLENFPLVTVIMPYYNPTHKWFLLLSSFSVGSRRTLDKNYKIFRRLMIQYSSELNYCSKDFVTKLAPWDLFRLNLNYGYFLKNKNYSIFYL